MMDFEDEETPLEIRLRGPEALAAYQEALEDGSTEFNFTRLMVVGQERVGKTSLVKAFMGQEFNSREEITDGVDASKACSVPFSEPSKWIPLLRTTEEHIKQLNEQHNYGVGLAAAAKLDPELKYHEGPSFPASESESQPQPLGESNQGINIASGKDKSETLSITHRHEQMTEIPESVKKAKKPTRDLEITFWDFAGPNLYYTTHQVFFNRRAIFALVFDMSKKLEEQCLVQDFSVEEEKACRFDDFTGEDFLKFWLQSIYTYAVPDFTDINYPPIFIIGTHKRDPHAMEEDLVKKQIFKIIRKKPYEIYVRRRFHFLENNPDKKQASDDEALSALKEAIAVSAMNAPHMKEKYPIKWINFHKAILELVGSGKHYMKYEEAKELAASLHITDESQFTTMLNLYHDLGVILWFGDHGQSLKSTVILDPQWLIDVFKAVITVKPYEKQDPNFTSLWRELHEYGILNEKLIDHVWRRWLDIIDDLLEIMEKFDLLVTRLRVEDEKVEQPLEYCVPACLQPDDKSEDENIRDGTFYVDFGNFLPDGFFHRVLVYFARWSSAHTGKAFKLFYRKCEAFVGRADNLHECSLLMIPSSARSENASIKVVVKRVVFEGENERTDPDPEVCTTVFEFIAKTLQELRDKWAKRIMYLMSVCCVACRDAGREKLHLIPVKDYKRHTFFCPRMKQKIAARELYWNAETDSPPSSDKLSSSKQPDQNKQRHVMISYSWGDKAKGFPCQQRMIQLKDELEEAGFPVWLDVQEMRGNMDDGMAETVDGAFVVLLCNSKEYQKSNSCKKEAQYARYQSKPIIPLKFDGHRPDGWLGLLIGNLMYYNVRTEETMMKNLPAIIEDLVDIMGPAAPLEILLRGKEAVEAYKEALKGGMKEMQSVRVMVVGQERVGKTSLLKALMGEGFDTGEEITDGVDTSNVCAVPISDLANWTSLKGRKAEEHKKHLDNKRDYEVRSAMERSINEKKYKPTKPGKPDGEIVDETSIKLSWSSPENDGGSEVTRYIIQQIEGGSVEEINLDQKVPNTTHTVSGLKPGNTYQFRLVAENKIGRSQPSAASDALKLPGYDEPQEPEISQEVTHADEEQQQDARISEKLHAQQDPKVSKEVTHAEKQQQDARISKKDRQSSKDETQTKKEHVPKEVAKAKKPPDELEITFWDFAGQNLYYTTHQVFFNSRAIFALLFDMSHKFEDQCMVGDFSASDKKTRLFDDFTGEDFFKFWLQSIYTYAVQDAADADNVEEYPPILIIGTHKRNQKAMGEDHAKKEIFRIIRGKPYRPYVRGKFHFLENNPADQQPSDDEAMKSLKKAIAETAMKAPHMKEKYPVNWINFHKAVLEEVAKGHHYMDYKKVEALAADQDITDETQITTMLNLYHDMGIIIWYGDHGQSLKNTVILDPQWLIDVFKAVITVKPDEEQDGKFSRLWEELKEHGILREKLINHVWHEWKDIKGPLLEIMEKFDIVVKNVSKSEGEKEKDDADADADVLEQSLVYCVPACLQPVDRSENIKDGTFYVDFGTFLPDGFFHRVLVYFARWSSAHTGEPFKLFYRKCESVVGPAENLHECSLLMIPLSALSQSASIKVVVKRIAEHGNESTDEDPDPEVCTRVYEFIAKTLQELKDKWAKGIKYQMSVCCVACSDAGGKLHLIPVEKCKGPHHVLCSEVKTKIPARKLYWNAKTDTPSLCDKPTASEVADHNKKEKGPSSSNDKSSELVTAEQMKQDTPSLSDKPTASEAGEQNKKEKGPSSSNDKSSELVTAEQMKQGHIMISYSWGKKAERFPCQQRMLQLRDDLQNAGFKVWLDVTGDLKGNLDVGMAEAIDNASVILLCFSEEYQNSESCQKEAQYAKYQSKPIIPLKFDCHRPVGWLGLLIGPLMYYDVKSEEAMKKNLPAITQCIKDIYKMYSKGNSDNWKENLTATDNTDGNTEGDQGKSNSADQVASPAATGNTESNQDKTKSAVVPNQPGKPIGEIVNETSIRIIWSAPKDDGGSPVSKYVIEQSSGSSGKWIRKEEVTSTTYTDSDLTPGNGYKYRVAAVNSVGSFSQFSDATNLLEIPSTYLVSPTYFIPVACIGAAAAVILWIVWFG